MQQTTYTCDITHKPQTRNKQQIFTCEGIEHFELLFATQVLHKTRSIEHNNIQVTLESYNPSHKHTTIE